ncbi:MAG: hypothetical protein IIB36_17265 [Gemmatimonadetes bacterium]|nr:hypothetical protein [Gemmatimonadota bacterium]
MPRKRTTRVFWRGARAWGDFRDYVDVGGGQERLVAPGESFATEDMVRWQRSSPTSA